VSAMVPEATDGQSGRGLLSVVNAEGQLLRSIVREIGV
jgi:hypothetical protein